MDSMQLNAFFCHNNVMKTQSIQYLPQKHSIMKTQRIQYLPQKHNNLVVKSLFFKKPVLPPPKSSQAFEVILEPLQKVLKQIGVAIPDSDMRAAVFTAVAGSVGWALVAIGTMISSKVQENSLPFKEDDLVDYKGEDCFVNHIGSSSITLNNARGPLKLDKKSPDCSMITNLCRVIPGLGPIVTFQIFLDVKEKKKEIRDLILNYMGDSKYLKGQKVYNFAIIIPNQNKIKVVGNLSRVDIGSPHFEKYQKVKAEILADLKQILDDNRPMPLCEICLAKIIKAAQLLMLIHRGWFIHRLVPRDKQ